MNRRDAMLLAVAAACLPVRAQAAAVTTEVAPGIHVRQGVHEQATAANANGIANIGFIIGDRSVAVIDPGGSRVDGQRLRARIQAVTDRPISHVVMSHMHPDHVFGAVAFEADNPVFVGHARMAGMLVQRGEHYRNMLADLLGLEEAGDYAKPGLLVEGTAQLDLGRRVLHVRAHPTAHTDNDLSVWDPATATIWMADLLFVDRVPSLDGSITGWLAQTQALRSTPALLAIPGHGPASVPWPEAAAAQERYLQALTREVRAVIARGGDMDHAVATVGLSEQGKWTLFPDHNGRNVTLAFKELEWE